MHRKKNQQHKKEAIAGEAKQNEAGTGSDSASAVAASAPVSAVCQCQVLAMNTALVWPVGLAIYMHLMTTCGVVIPTGRLTRLPI